VNRDVQSSSFFNHVMPSSEKSRLASSSFVRTAASLNVPKPTCLYARNGGTFRCYTRVIHPILRTCHLIFTFPARGSVEIISEDARDRTHVRTLVIYGAFSETLGRQWASETLTRYRTQKYERFSAGWLDFRSINRAEKARLSPRRRRASGKT